MKTKILIISFLFLTACGTDTGNPGAMPTNQGTDAAIGLIDRPGDEVIPTFVEEVCNRYTECGSSTYKACESAIYQLDEIDTEIGLPEGVYNNLQEVNKDFSDEVIKESPDEFNQCLSDIQNLTCSELNFTPQPHPENNPLAGIAETIPSSCSEIVQD